MREPASSWLRAQALQLRQRRLQQIAHQAQYAMALGLRSGPFAAQQHVEGQRQWRAFHPATGAFRQAPADPYSAVEILSSRGDLREAAANLFACLHRLDRSGTDMILAEPVPEEGLGAAIMDRLRKAAAGSGPAAG